MSLFSKDQIKENTSTFIGQVLGGEIKRSTFGKKQLEIQVQPLDHETKGPYLTWVPLPDDGKPIRMGSRLAELIEKLADLNFELTTDKQRGEVGELLTHPTGGIFRFERGKKSYDGGRTQSDFLLPTEALSAEQAQAEITANGGVRKKKTEDGGNSNPTESVTRSSAPASEYTTEDVDYVLEQIAEAGGLARPAMVQLAARNTRVSGNKSLQRYIMSGAFVSEMTANGRLTEDNGVFNVVV